MVDTSNRLKMKEDIVQLKVCVPIRDLWKVMSSDLIKARSGQGFTRYGEGSRDA